VKTSFLGIELNKARNAENALVISAPTGRVIVRIIRTDEDDDCALGLPDSRLSASTKGLNHESKDSLSGTIGKLDACGARRTISRRTDYLYDNPLLKSPEAGAHQTALLGTGHDAGLNFIYAT